MIPIVGEVCTALVRQRVKVVSINDDDRANVALIPGTPLPDNAVIMMNGVPFRYLTGILKYDEGYSNDYGKDTNP